mgnify:CR=1 FL=1
MSEVKKIATRESYGNALAELGAEFDNLVVLDADLAAATKTGIFKKAFPERHIDCGIAECNMMGIAAGLATTGKVPFASSFAMFAAGRAFEQVRNSIGYPHLNVKIGATHAGISVGEDGATHQCNEDIALMRTIPGMTVIVPSDDVEAKAAVRAAYEHDGPCYLRFGRLAVPVINDKPDYKFELGKGVVLREGKDVTIVATGLPVSNCLEAAEKLTADGIDAIQPVTWESWVQDTYSNRQFQSTVVGVDAANMTARAMLERFTSDYAKNFINYSNPAYDALFQQAINATDEAAQTDLYKQMETMLADTAANVYIQDLSDLVAMRQDLGGLKFYPIYVLDLSTVYLTQQ